MMVGQINIIDSNLLKTVDHLTNSIRCFGHQLPDRPLQVSPILSTVSIPDKEAITRSLKTYLDVISTSLPTMSNRKLDLSHFEIFCRVAGITLLDPDFMNCFTEGDICEIYSTTHQQLFRNLEFFKSCSYDLFTMTALPWNELFLRPDDIQKETFAVAQRILSERIPSMTNIVRPHLIQECYAGHSKYFLYSVKKAGCLFDVVTREPKGYATIIRVEELNQDTKGHC